MSLRRELPSPTPRRIRTATALLALLLAAATFVSLPAKPAAADEVGNWLGVINTFRQQQGLNPLILDGNLSDLAAQQASRMAQAGQLFHTSNLAAGVTSNWTKLGENVGMGLNTDIIWQAFLNSPPHRGNLTDPAFTHIGIGVVYSGNTQWVVHRFMGVASAPPPAVQTPEPEAPPVTAPPQTAPPVTRPPTTRPPTTVATLPPPTTTTTTAPPPEPVVVPAASAPDRAAALLDALHRIE